MVKSPPANAGDTSSISGSGRSPGEGNGNPLQYSCLENPMDGGAWWATVHGVTKSQTKLSDWQQHKAKTPNSSGRAVSTIWGSIKRSREENDLFNTQILNLLVSVCCFFFFPNDLFRNSEDMQMLIFHICLWQVIPNKTHKYEEIKRISKLNLLISSLVD